VTVTAEGQPVPLPSLRTDGLGRFAQAVRLRLPCGPTTFSAVDAAGRRANDLVEVRCPALRLDPDTVDRGSLPVDVPAEGSGFDSDAPLDVTLDGVDVGDVRADDAGRAELTVPAASDLRCGIHHVALQQRGKAPAPRAEAALTVACPPSGTPLLDVAPDVVAHGQIALVTARDLPPGPVRLLWRHRDGTQRAALPRTVDPVEGRLRLRLLLMDGERPGPRRLLALTDGGLVVADTEVTLVVVNPFQPGRHGQESRVGLLGRR
jgi:hypothetical protein